MEEVKKLISFPHVLSLIYIQMESVCVRVGGTTPTPTPTPFSLHLSSFSNRRGPGSRPSFKDQVSAPTCERVEFRVVGR